MIPVYVRANVGFLRRHPWQLAMALVGIVIGVGVIVAVDLANSSARKAFMLSMDAVTGRATHQVVGGPRGIDERDYVSLRVERGLKSIAPVVEGYVSTDEATLKVIGVDVFAEPAVRSFTNQTMSADDEEAQRAIFRQLLTVDGAVLMSVSRAASLGLKPGDRFQVATSGKTFSAMLIGTYATTVSTGLNDVLTADIATAQAWFGMQGHLSRIDVRLEPDDAAAELRLAGMLPAGTALLSAQGRTRSTSEMSQAFMTNLTAMSLLALLVGLFLIYNSVSFTVLQRRSLIGTLRALGVTRGQAFGLVIGESFVLGALGTTIGTVVGVGLGEQLLSLVAQSINDFYFRITVTDVSLDLASFVKGAGAGFLATLLAALVPAFEAAAYRPRLSLMRSALEQRTGRLLPIVTGIGLLSITAAVIVLVGSGRSLLGGLVAVFLLLLGFALCIPQLVKIGTRILAPVMPRRAGVTGRIAVAGIGAGLSRTGVAVVALSVAVSATIGVSVMVDSFRNSVDRWLEQTLQADIYAGVDRGGLDPVLISEFSSLPEVVALSTLRRVWLEDESGRTQLRVIDMAPGSFAGVEILDAEPQAVWSLFERDDIVLVSEPYAYRNRLAPGDSVRLRTASGARAFQVLATYQSYDIDASALLMSRETYDRHFQDPRVDSIGLYLAPDTDPAEVVARLEAISADRQELMIDSNRRIRELSLAIFDRTFIITDVLYYLALGVAVLGILGAMLALQLERAREFAILRALGVTPRQLEGLIVMQTAVIGVFAGIAAMPLGVTMAYVLIEVINRRAFGWTIDMAVAPGILLSALLMAVTAAILAGLYPAWRAAHSVPAFAMREE